MMALPHEFCRFVFVFVFERLKTGFASQSTFISHVFHTPVTTKNKEIKQETNRVIDQRVRSLTMTQYKARPILSGSYLPSFPRGGSVPGMFHSM